MSEKAESNCSGVLGLAGSITRHVLIGTVGSVQSVGQQLLPFTNSTVALQVTHDGQESKNEQVDAYRKTQIDILNKLLTLNNADDLMDLMAEDIVFSTWHFPAVVGKTEVKENWIVLHSMIKIIHHETIKYHSIDQYNIAWEGTANITLQNYKVLDPIPQAIFITFAPETYIIKSYKAYWDATPFLLAVGMKIELGKDGKPSQLMPGIYS